MKPRCTFSGQSLAAVLLVTFGITAGSCADHTPRPGGSTGELSSLAISPASDLMPGFSSTTTNYSVTAPSDSPSVVVLANTDDSAATITINGLEIPPGAKQSVQLNPAGMSTPIEIVATTPDGATTYDVAVTRVAQCTPVSADGCCPQDYQERDCGNGNCGKQSRTCSAFGQWEDWSVCGVSSAKVGQVCRPKATSCDPAEFCGAAPDCPADYVEYSLEGYAGCWQNISSPSIDVRGACYLPPPPPGYNSCKPNDQVTADHICVTRGYKGAKHGSIVNEPVASDIVGWVVWNGSNWVRETGRVFAMTHLACLK